jgi:hypothetical protein
MLLIHTLRKSAMFRKRAGAWNTAREGDEPVRRKPDLAEARENVVWLKAHWLPVGIVRRPEWPAD